MGDGVIKSYIWSFVNRFLHFVLIISLGIVLASLYFWEKALWLHSLMGLVFGGAVGLRIVWGFVGSRYSVFRDFEYRGVLEYLKSIADFIIKKTPKRHYIGHNPASSWAILLMLLLGIIIACSGLLEYGISQNSGIFAFLFYQYSKVSFIQEIHKISAYLLFGIVIIHIIGALIDTLTNGDGILSMITGKKKTPQKIALVLSDFQKAFSVLAILGVIGILSLGNGILKNHFQPLNYAKLNADFEKECGSCHLLYPPYLLPKKSWEIMMGDLENHFGDDASIDEESRQEILKFLSQNAAENFDTKVSQNIIKSQKDSSNIAITQNEYWIAKHKNINQEVFKRESIQSRANCFACHKGIEYGVLQKDLIKIPK